VSSSGLNGAGVKEPFGVRLAAARNATDAKEWHRAAELWDALRRDHPQERLFWDRAGQAYFAAGQWQAAAPLLDEAVERFPDDAGIGYWHIQVARKRGDWDEALRRSERLREALPDDWRGWVASAEALSALGRDTEALCRHRDAAERFPGEFWPNFGLAWVTARQRGDNDAVRIWSELASRFPDREPAREALERARRAAERHEPGPDLAAAG
jgi:tetratricopeptide (TPR) repeat protein